MAGDRLKRPKHDASLKVVRMLTPSEIESLRQEAKESLAYMRDLRAKRREQKQVVHIASEGDNDDSYL